MSTTSPESPREGVFTCVLGEEKLLFHRLEGTEELGRPFLYRIEVMRKSDDAGLDVDSLMGTKATVFLLHDTGVHRAINGYVTAIEQGGKYKSYDIFRLELRPWLWHLSLHSDSQIFQDKTTLDIIEAVLATYSGYKHSKSLGPDGGKRKRHYCVQYRETDLDFISRLMEEDGLYYYFKHTGDNHELVIADGRVAPAAIPHVAELVWLGDANLRSHDTAEEANVNSTSTISEWRQVQVRRPVAYHHSDYDYLASATQPKAEASYQDNTTAPKDGYAFWSYPGDYVEADEATSTSQGAPLADVVTTGWQAASLMGVATTRSRNVAPGHAFTYRTGAEPPYRKTDHLIVAIDLDVQFGDFEATHSDTDVSYTARVRCIPKTQRFATPQYTPRPTVAGPQTARVVGPDGSEIHTDKYGRIKIRFHWDRVGQGKGEDTCWVRVATPWASQQYGMIALPRVGDEVVVSFLEGNPDRPLVTGSVYNNANMPPYGLPDHATVSGIRTRSSTGGGATDFNELRFDDKKGSEYVWLQAQKDFHRLVKHDDFDTVQGEQWQLVEKQSKRHVKENSGTLIDKQASLKVGEDAHASIGNELNLKVGQAMGVDVGQGIDVKAGQAIKLKGLSLSAALDTGVKAKGQTIDLKGDVTITLEAGTTISLKAGGSFITIGPSGVSISGAMVMINSGGSGSSAQAADAAAPAAPKDPVADKDNQDPLAGGSS